MHNASAEALRSSTISEIQQSLAMAHAQLNVAVSTTINVYCVGPNAHPDLFLWFDRIVTEALGAIPPAQVRLHYFGVLSDAQTEIAEWERSIGEFCRYGGGAYLLTTAFRGVRLDRLRTYDVLARLVQVFGFTRKSRLSRSAAFTDRRDKEPFRVFIAGLESYAAPSHSAAAEWLFDSVLWEQLQGRLPLTVGETKLDTNYTEHWLMKAARDSSSISELAVRLKSFGAKNSWISDAGFELQVAATNSARQRPAAETTHVLERTILPYDNGEIWEKAKRCTGSMFETFAFPVQTFFLAGVRQSKLVEALRVVRKHQCGELASAIGKRFYQESVRLHREWFPANNSARGDATNATAALDIRVPRQLVFLSCHVDPSLAEDDRDELLIGPERVQFVYLIPITAI
jgi:hypothetical protein